MIVNGYEIKPGANLSGADLSGALLFDADLRKTSLICVGNDNRGYRFWAWKNSDGKIIYRAGCREWDNYKMAVAHYGDRYSSNGNRAECIARLKLLKCLAEGV